MEGGEEGSDRSDVSEVGMLCFGSPEDTRTVRPYNSGGYVCVNQDGSVGGEGGEVAEVAQGLGKEDFYGQNQA